MRRSLDLLDAVRREFFSRLALGPIKVHGDGSRGGGVAVAGSALEYAAALGNVECFEHGQALEMAACGTLRFPATTARALARLF